MLTAVAAVFVFGLLVMVHELGHLLAAKRVGIKVYEFSMGFGPKICGLTWGDTVYALRILPLGGFVRMAGMENEDQDVEGSFSKKTVLQRIGVTVAGPFMNFVLAAFLFIIVFTVLGIPAGLNSIGEVFPGTPAERAGLRAGDRIVMVDDKATSDWEEVTTNIRAAQDKPVRLEVDREGSRFPVVVTPEFNGEYYMIGIKIMYVRMGIIQGVTEGFRQTVLLTGAIIEGLTHVSPKDLSGPVGITRMIGDTAERGLPDLLFLAGVLSINLGILNLLPIPALDGSRVVFMLVEKLRGRPIEPDREGLIHLIGFALLMVLVLAITYQDILNINRVGG